MAGTRLQHGIVCRPVEQQPAPEQEQQVRLVQQSGVLPVRLCNCRPLFVLLRCVAATAALELKFDIAGGGFRRRGRILPVVAVVLCVMFVGSISGSRLMTQITVQSLCRKKAKWLEGPP